MLRQQEAVAADRRLRDAGAPAGKGKQCVVRRIAGGNRVQWLMAYESGPLGRPGDPASGHEVSFDSTKTPAREPQKVCPGRADECFGPGNVATLVDVPAPGRGVEYRGHQAETEDRQERDIEVDRHRLKYEYPISLAKFRRMQQRGGARRALRDLSKGDCACACSRRLDDRQLLGPLRGLINQDLTNVHTSEPVVESSRIREPSENDFS